MAIQDSFVLHICKSLIKINVHLDQFSFVALLLVTLNTFRAVQWLKILSNDEPSSARLKPLSSSSFECATLMQFVKKRFVACYSRTYLFFLIFVGIGRSFIYLFLCWLWTWYIIKQCRCLVLLVIQTVNILNYAFISLMCFNIAIEIAARAYFSGNFFIIVLMLS